MDCENCKGSGRCPGCQGSTRVTVESKTGETYDVGCPECDCTGGCSWCLGTGYQQLEGYDRYLAQLDWDRAAGRD
jgi:hypothetical protein